MSKNQLATWAVVITTFMAWNLFGHTISSWIYSSFTNVGLPVLAVQLLLLILPLILLLEIGVKLLFLQSAAPPLKFVSTQPELWQHINQDELTYYTSELEELGFVYLTDYTSPSFQGMARLFAHPQHFCFAEVGQLNGLPMFCSMSCHLEKRWWLGITNMPSNANLFAISYAFLREPRSLVKRFENASVDVLFNSLLDWREQALKDLNLNLIPDITAEAYFERERSKRAEQRRSLLRKSIIWGLIEMLWFSLNPKSEWLGDYSKLKVKI